MPTISTSIGRSTTRSMWREVLAESPLPRSLHRFLSFLSRFLGHGGRFSWTSIKVVIRQWAIENGRRAYTQRWILALLRKAVDAGLIRRVRYSGPGQPAVYEAVIPGHPGCRPATIRPRGIRPRRLLASFRKDTAMSKMDWEGAARRDRVRGFAPEWLPETTARHAGSCAKCHEAYAPGACITRYAAGWGHLDCTDALIQAAEPPPPPPLPRIDPAEIAKCRTAKGGYSFTREWFLDHGLPYPPPKGWRKEVERPDEWAWA